MAIQKITQKYYNSSKHDCKQNRKCKYKLNKLEKVYNANIYNANKKLKKTKKINKLMNGGMAPIDNSSLNEKFQVTKIGDIDLDQLKISEKIKINWMGFPEGPPTDCIIL